MYTPPKPYSSNYEFSQAITKCNDRLTRLKAQQNMLYNQRGQAVDYTPYYNYCFPQRRPVYPNPIIYSYQFIPPVKKDPIKPPIKTTPVQIPKIVYGQAMHQERPPDKSGFTGDEFRMLVAGGNYMKQDPKHATFLKEVVDYKHYVNNLYKPPYVYK